MVDTFTTRLALLKPDPTDAYSVGVYSGSMDTVDANIGYIVCTSSTRPSSPWAGMPIYETDTGRKYIRIGATWMYMDGGVFTSSTRPAAPVLGATIFESDTGFNPTWNGSAWIYPPSSVGQGTYTQCTGTSTALGSSSWTQIPFATLAAGTELNMVVSGAGAIFTLGAGLWEVTMSAVIDQTSHTGVTGAFFAIGTGNLNSGGSAYAQTNSPVCAGQVSGALATKVLSTGTAAVSGYVYPAGAASAIFLTGALGVPKISFKQIPN